MYDEDVAGLEETLVRTLKEKGLTLSTAESCTGGLIAQRITSVPGSSEVFGYGFVTYWEAAKARLVGVEPDVIAKYNVVSAPVAAQMALGAAQAAGAEIGISVTGVAGPTGGDALRPVGTVYLGAARGETVYVKSCPSPGPTVHWCVPVPRRLPWSWPCGWHREKFLQAQSPLPGTHSTAPKRWTS